MRNQSILLTATLAALALLAACGSKEPPAAPTATGPATPGEAAPAAQPAGAPAATPAPPAASTPAAASKPAKPATPAPKPVQIVTVPAGTALAMTLSTGLSSKTAKVGDPVKAMLTSDVQVDGKIMVELSNGIKEHQVPRTL